MSPSDTGVPDFNAYAVLEKYESLRKLVQTPAARAPAQVFADWEDLRRVIAGWKARIQLQARQDSSDEAAIANSRVVAEVSPVFEAYDADLKAFFLAAENRPRMQRIVGDTTLGRWEADVTAFSPAIQSELTLEASLTDEYFQRLGGIRASVRGREFSLARLASFTEHKDRLLRREASEASWDAVNACSGALDSLFDELVRCRASMAKKLGYDDYVGLAYKRLGRLDYGPHEVAVFREEIAESIVPLAAQFARQQAQELGIDELMPWDEAIHDASPPEAPTTADELMAALRSAAAAIHPTFADFLNIITQAHLTDLSERPGKASGAFCTFFPDIGMPFVFTSYAGTFRSIRSVIHELGHAFQNYRSRHHASLEQIIPTAEIGEVHSMALELLVCPLYGALVKSDWERCLKYEVRYLVAMLPYIAAIDHFQELVYCAPTATPADRREMWLQMENRYLRGRRFGGISALKAGGRWHRQRHVYAAPFLYIEYALAICCSLQLWIESTDDRGAAMEKWIQLCSLGGTLSFKALLNEVSLRSPFRLGALAEVVSKASEIASH